MYLFFQMLKSALLAQGFPRTKIVAGDAMSWDILTDYLNSSLLRKSLDVIG